MSNPRNLPFAMYDLAVYLPGGAVCLVLLQVVVETFTGPMDLPIGADKDSAVQQIITAVIWLAASYLTGHLAAFISSYVVEKFVHNNLGFPSDIWLQSERDLETGKSRESTFRDIFDSNLRAGPRRWVPRLIKLIQLPAAVPLFLVAWLKPFGFYTPKIPSGLIRPVSDRFAALDCNIRLERGTRWEKAVEHFVANNCPAAYTRMYNYLVIYGVLRLMALIIISVLWFLLLRDIVVKLEAGFTLSWKLTLLFNVLAFAYVLAVMAFAKFNRRYFEETILALVFGTKAAQLGGA